MNDTDSHGWLQYGLQDMEQVRLVLNGQSVVDWRRLALRDLSHVDELLLRVGLDSSQPEDMSRLNRLHEIALDYVIKHLERNLDQSVVQPNDVRELLLMASRGGKTQQDACMLLKVMHIIHHTAGRELLYQLPIPISELFYQVERDVFRAVDGMKSFGVNVAEFAGSRKAEHAIITKLLCRRDSLAAQVHDRLRFRIVTEALDDVLAALVYMTRHLLPFNYIVPGESRNDLMDLEATMEGDDGLRPLRELMQTVADSDEGGPRINHFSDKAYNDINFVVDMPVRLDDALISGSALPIEKSGRVVFLMVEFQVVDRKTHRRNNQGASRHALYKERQRQRAFDRLEPWRKN